MADNEKPIHMQGDISAGEIQTAIAAIGHGAQVTITVGGDLTIQRVVRPDFDRLENRALARYLQQLYDWADRQLKQNARIFLDAAAWSTPDAVQPEFDFGSRFRAPVIRPDAPGQQPGDGDPTPETFATFAAAFEHHSQRMLLLGDPGMGKTTALLNLARSAAARRLEDPGAPIPILASIYTWDHETPLAEWANPPGLPLDNQPLLYLLDGLDELGGKRPRDPKKPDGEHFDPRADFIHATEKLPAQAALLISSRVKDYTEIEGAKLRLPGAATLQPLVDEQVQRYLEAREQADLWQAIREDESLLELARTPLLLALIAVGFAGKQAKLTNVTRSDVFDHYIHARFEHELSRLPKGESLPFDEATTRELLGRIAARMWREWPLPKTSLPLNEIRELINIRPDILMSFKQWLWQLGFFQKHSQIQSTDKFIVFGQQMHLIHLIQRSSGDYIQFIHLTFRDYCAFPYLLQALHVHHHWGRDNIANALGKIGALDAVPELMKALYDQNKNLRMQAAQALGRIGASSAIPALLEALQDEDNGVRSSAAWALGHIGDSATIPALLQTLRYTDSVTRDSAIQALGLIGNPIAVPYLLMALRISKWKKNIVINALKRIGSPATPALLEALHDHDSWIRENAAEALGQIGDPAAVSGLIERLSDTEKPQWGRKRICDMVAEALEKIGTPEALAAVEQWRREQRDTR